MKTNQIQASILISSHGRIPLLRRTLWSIAMRGPSVPFEVIVADDNEDEAERLAALNELKNYSSAFLWKFVVCDTAEFERETGVRKFFNNPSWTNNVAFDHTSPSSNRIYQQGNEVIAWGRAYNELFEAWPTGVNDVVVMSTTYDLLPNCLEGVDDYGANLDDRAVEASLPYPLQSQSYRSDVTNYLSLASRGVWEGTGGYDERFVGVLGGEDSDFIRRARTLPGFQTFVSDGVSLHQSHGGFTRYYEADPSVISRERRREGEAAKWRLYDSWDGTRENRQPWPKGLGVAEVVSNGC